MGVQLTVVKGAMRSLANGAACGALESLNILPQDLNLVCGSIPWQPVERNIVNRTLSTLLYGSLDLMGLDRFDPPAEYVAAGISMFVHDINKMVACKWMETGLPSAEYLGNPIGSVDSSPVMAQQLFALVVQLNNDGEVTACRSQFEQRVNMVVDQLQKKGDQNAQTHIKKVK